MYITTTSTVMVLVVVVSEQYDSNSITSIP